MNILGRELSAVIHTRETEGNAKMDIAKGATGEPVSACQGTVAIFKEFLTPTYKVYIHFFRRE